MPHADTAPHPFFHAPRWLRENAPLIRQPRGPLCAAYNASTFGSISEIAALF